MNAFIAIISLFNLCTLVNFSSSESVESLISEAIDEVKPHHTTLWSNFEKGSINNSKYFPSYKLALKTIVNKTPTIIVNMNDMEPINIFNPDAGSIYNYSEKISAPLHLIFITEDFEEWYFIPPRTTKSSLIHFYISNIHKSIFQQQSTCLFFIKVRTRQRILVRYFN